MENDEIKVRVRRLEIACSVLAGLIICLCTYMTFKIFYGEIRTRGLKVCDSKGVLRCQIAVDTFDNAPLIELYDSKEKARIILRLDEHGIPFLNFVNEKNVVMGLKDSAFGDFSSEATNSLKAAVTTTSTSLFPRKPAAP